MKKSYSKQEKEKIIKQHESGFSITSIHNSPGIARSTLYSWINGHRSDTIDKPLNRSDYNKLKMHCEKLENMIQILKICGCSVDTPLNQRYEVIKGLSSVYSITTLINAYEEKNLILQNCYFIVTKEKIILQRLLETAYCHSAYNNHFQGNLFHMIILYVNHFLNPLNKKNYIEQIINLKSIYGRP